MFRDNEVIFLLGAGCSFEAGIPHTKKMIEKIEDNIKNGQWKRFEEIYYLIKASILYSRGIKGTFDRDVNVEELVNLLLELEKRDETAIFPFIGTWNPKLLSVAGHTFEVIGEFSKAIVEELNKWLVPDNYGESSYYKKLYEFQKELNYPLRVFSLNYDLCLERNIPPESTLERGFDKTDRIWQWRRFTDNPDIGGPALYLYKLHGSIDWKRDLSRGNQLRETDGFVNEPELIFGTTYKLRYVDPYLFYTYEFRRFSLESTYIIALGYGFNDEHINGIIRQSLEMNPERKVLAISYMDKKKIESLLNLKSADQVIAIENIGAKEFLKNLSANSLKEILGIKSGLSLESDATPF